MTQVRPTLLIVEDNELNRDILNEILKDEYKTYLAENGAEGLRLLRQHSAEIDLVLLDIEMPVMNGIETLEQIRKQQAFCNLPVMFLTADINEETMAAAERLGTVGYVKKPYIPQEFLEKVENVL